MASIGTLTLTENCNAKINTVDDANGKYIKEVGFRVGGSRVGIWKETTSIYVKSECIKHLH